VPNRSGSSSRATAGERGSYVASWNESDPAKRRLTIEKTWSPEGIYRNATAEPPEIASASITRARRRRGRRLRR
jgi:hypothetical protein